MATVGTLDVGLRSPLDCAGVTIPLQGVRYDVGHAE